MALDQDFDKLPSNLFGAGPASILFDITDSCTPDKAFFAAVEDVDESPANGIRASTESEVAHPLVASDVEFKPHRRIDLSSLLKSSKRHSTLLAPDPVSSW